MPFMMCYGLCYGCQRLFHYNPNRVPSLRDAEGVRQAICWDCVARANVTRAQNGLALIEPLPGAYEACAEEAFVIDEDSPV